MEQGTNKSLAVIGQWLAREIHSSGDREFIRKERKSS